MEILGPILILNVAIVFLYNFGWGFQLQINYGFLD